MPSVTIHPLRPLPLDQVALDGGFWGPRLHANRTVTIPLGLAQCRRSGRIAAFRLNWKPGRPRRPHIFWDSDVAKWIEAAAWSLAARPDARLRGDVARIVETVVAAQQPDGYLNTHFTAVRPRDRWTNLRDWHELYCAGHLIEAAVAWRQATGDGRLLAAMERYADLIGQTFGRGRGQRPGYPGHQEIELALVGLYRQTGDRRRLELARYFIDQRGRSPNYFQREARARGERADYDLTACQAHVPVREQRDAVGHAVRAMYLYCGMADVAAETGDAALRAACRRLFDSATARRMYVTGGVGSRAGGERFTFDYDLPNETAYAETCAAIGLVFFAHRMLQLDPDGRYADVMERALYNGVLAGVSLDGGRFFYANRLAVFPPAAPFLGAHQTPTRQPTFGAACCPPNVARLLASLGRYVYSQSPRELFVHLYVQGRAEAELGGRRVRVVQRTDYPWRESVRLAVEPEQPTTFTLALRVPGWCRGARARVNGSPIALGPLVRRGYARLRRRWQAGDRVELVLPMPPERVEAHPDVRADSGRVALTRGPIVYCLEQADNGPGLAGLFLPPRAALKARFVADLLGGVVAIDATGRRRTADARDRRLYRPARTRSVSARLRAVPYSLWCNRRPGEMTVWLAQA